MPLPAPLNPESFGPPPRKVKFVKTPDEPRTLIVLFIFSFIGLLIACYVIHFSLVVFLGTPINATVIRTIIDTDDGTSFHIEYQYQFAGNTYTDIGTVEKQTYEDHTPPHPDHPIVVRHLQLGILTSSYIPWPFSSLSHPLYFLYLWTLVWCAFTWSFFTSHLSDMLLQRRLCIHGTQASGTITDRIQKPDNDNGFTYEVTYTYTNPATGMTHTHHQKVPAMFWGATEHEPSVVILFDPQAPRKHILYLLAQWRIIS